MSNVSSRNPLQSYLELSHQTPTDLARRIGCAPSTIRRILAGQRGATAKTAQAISAATGGHVTPAQIRALAVEVTPSTD